MTENGSVKRGVLESDINGNLLSIRESSIIEDGDKILCTPLNGDKELNAAMQLKHPIFSLQR